VTIFIRRPSTALADDEGNRDEESKEYSFYLDRTLTLSMTYRYRYRQTGGLYNPLVGARVPFQEVAAACQDPSTTRC